MKILSVNPLNNFANKINLNKTNSVSKPAFGMAYLPKDVFEKINIIGIIHDNFIPDEVGNLHAHRASAHELYNMHFALRCHPETIAAIHLTKNSYGDLPLHIAANKSGQELTEIQNVLNDKTLIKAHLTANRDGNLPMHLANLKNMQEIHKALAEYPETLVQIHSSKNYDGELPMCKFGSHALDEMHNACKKDYNGLANLYMNIPQYVLYEFGRKGTLSTLLENVLDLAAKSDLDSEKSKLLLNKYLPYDNSERLSSALDYMAIYNL